MPYLERPRRQDYTSAFGPSRKIGVPRAGGITETARNLSRRRQRIGSTLRFLVPVAVLSGNRCTFSGRGRLAKRPLTPYYNLFDEKSIAYETTEGGLPLTVEGRLEAGTYALQGDVSSQFFRACS